MLIRSLALIVTLICCHLAYTQDYSTARTTTPQSAFIVHSSPTFQGYHYHGSDQTHHYFVESWSHKADRPFKIAKSDLTTSVEHTLAAQVRPLFQSQPSNRTTQVFATYTVEVAQEMAAITGEHTAQLQLFIE